MNFDQIVREIAEHYSYAEIARRVGVSRSYIAMIANGDRKNISYETGAQLIELHKNRGNDI